MTSPTSTAGPSPIKILTSHSAITVLDALAPAFERASGQRYSVESAGGKPMFARIKGGETADVVLLGPEAVDEFVALGIVAAGSRRLIFRSRIGVAVRTGAPKPDISTVEAFKRTLLNARSVAHTVHGRSGMYLQALMQRLGIAEQMKSRIVTRPGGYIARVVATGEAEIAIQMIVELLAVPGVDLVGPLPDEIQQVFETVAGVFAASKRAEVADALIQFLLSPDAAPVFKEKGLEQVR